MRYNAAADADADDPGILCLHQGRPPHAGAHNACSSARNGRAAAGVRIIVQHYGQLILVFPRHRPQQ